MEAGWDTLRHVIFDRDGLALSIAALAGALVLIVTAVAGTVVDWWQRRDRKEGPSRWRAMLANMRPPYRPHKPGRLLAAVAVAGWPAAFYALTRDVQAATVLAAVALTATVADLARRWRWARWLERRERQAVAAIGNPEPARLTEPVTVVMPRKFPNLEGRQDG